MAASPEVVAKSATITGRFIPSGGGSTLSGFARPMESLGPRLADVRRDLRPSGEVAPDRGVAQRADRRVILRKVTTFDCDQMSDLIPGVHIEHRLLEPGTFEADAVHVRTARFRFDYLRYSRRVALNCEFPGGTIGIAFALRAPEPLVAYGIPQPSCGFMHFDPAAGLDLQLPGGAEVVLLSVARDVFQAERLRRRGDGLTASTFVNMPLRMPDPLRRRLAALIKKVVDEAERLPGDQQVVASAGELDDDLFDAVMTASVLARPPAATGHGALARRRRLVLRTEEYIYAHIDDSIRLKRLCRDVGASARTLEYAFKGMYGIGVMESLRTLRLNEVRKKLLRSAAEDVTVTTAAMDWGFWHLGEFAGAYKRLFGELPSQTLQFRRQGVPTLETCVVPTARRAVGA
jgi:AraC family transcriptional regulator, ethanolamine operon transcriptional activator